MDLNPPPYEDPTIAGVVREHVLKTLRAARGNRTRAAQTLGIDRRTLYRYLHVYAEAGYPVPAVGCGATDPQSELAE